MKFIILFLSLFLFTTLSYSQHEYKQYLDLSYAEIDSLMYIEYGKGAFDKAIPLMQAGRSKAKDQFGEQDSLFASYTGNVGFFYQKLGEYKKALRLYIQAKDITETLLGNAHPAFATSLNNLARLHHDMGNYEKALPLFIQAKNIREQTLGTINPVFASSLNNLAGLHRDMGNYERALPLYTQTKDIVEKTLGTNHPNYAISLNNLADLYQHMENYKKALSLYIQAKNIREKKLGANHPHFAQTLSNLARVYQDMNNYEKALPLFIQAKTIEEKVLGKMHPSYATSLQNLAGIHEDIGNYENALPLYLQAKNIQKKMLGTAHPLFAGTLNNLARLYTKIGMYKEAWETLGLSMNSLSGLDLNHNFDKKWLEEFKNASYASNEHLRQLLFALRHVYLLLKKDDSVTNTDAKQVIVADLATALLAKARNQVLNEQDKLRMLSLSNNWLLLSLEGLVPEKDRNKAFKLADQNKSVLLLQATKSEKIYRLGNLSDSLAQKNTELTKKQSALKAKLYENRPKPEKDSLRSLLNEVNQELAAFAKMLKENYPKYHQLKHQEIATKVDGIQDLLDEQTALIEYVIGDSVIHIFAVTKEQVQWGKSFVATSLIKARIQKMHKALSDYKLVVKNTELAYQKYTTQAHWFYQKLLAPVLEGQSTIKDLIIVTDGELGHLPFEAFLVEQAPQGTTVYNKLHYLINDYNISYNYSASLWKENKEAPNPQNNGKLFALAANYNIQLDSSKSDLRLPTDQWLREALKPLPAARKEVEVLQERYQGFFAFDSLASERIVKSEASDYAVLHFAVHGILDKDRPVLSSLALSEDGDSTESNFWQAHEISKMPLSANLVVLSACETGYGKFEKGNGIASLARAFMYAGAPSLIVSLWQVNDAATSVIMQNIYQNIAEGQPIHQALRQAKLDYIQKAKGVTAHPAFWSPFIQIGKNKPIHIKEKGGYWPWLIGGSLVLLLLLGGFALSRQKKETD